MYKIFFLSFFLFVFGNEGQKKIFFSSICKTCITERGYLGDLIKNFLLTQSSSPNGPPRVRQGARRSTAKHQLELGKAPPRGKTSWAKFKENLRQGAHTIFFFLHLFPRNEPINLRGNNNQKVRHSTEISIDWLQFYCDNNLNRCTR